MVRLGPRLPLTRRLLVATAVELADAEGLDAVSIRRVARELNTRPMTFYSHIACKDDLLDLMADEVIGEFYVDDLPHGWDGALRAIAERAFASMLRHPWFVEAHRTCAGPKAARHIEQIGAAVASLGVDEERVGLVCVALDSFTAGVARAALPDGSGLQHPWLADGRVEASFAVGLQCLLAGLGVTYGDEARTRN